MHAPYPVMAMHGAKRSRDARAIEQSIADADDRDDLPAIHARPVEADSLYARLTAAER